MLKGMIRAATLVVGLATAMSATALRKTGSRFQRVRGS